MYNNSRLYAPSQTKVKALISVLGEGIAPSALGKLLTSADQNDIIYMLSGKTYA